MSGEIFIVIHQKITFSCAAVAGGEKNRNGALFERGNLSSRSIS